MAKPTSTAKNAVVTTLKWLSGVALVPATAGWFVALLAMLREPALPIDAAAQAFSADWRNSVRRGAQTSRR